MKLIFTAESAKELFVQLLDFSQNYSQMNPAPMTLETPPSHPIAEVVTPPSSLEMENEAEEEYERINPRTGKLFKKRGGPRKDPVKGDVLPEPVKDDKTLLVGKVVSPLKPELTKEDTLNALKSLTEKKGMEVGKKLLTKFMAVRVSDIKPEFFQSFIDSCEELATDGE